MAGQAPGLCQVGQPGELTILPVPHCIQPIDGRKHCPSPLRAAGQLMSGVPPPALGSSLPQPILPPPCPKRPKETLPQSLSAHLLCPPVSLPVSKSCVPSSVWVPKGNTLSPPAPPAAPGEVAALLAYEHRALATGCSPACPALCQDVLALPDGGISSHVAQAPLPSAPSSSQMEAWVSYWVRCGPNKHLTSQPALQLDLNSDQQSV